MQRRSAYRRPAPNSICDPSISGGALAYFCDDSPRVPYGIADIVTWTRTWATVPLLYNSFSTISVIYPGYSSIDAGVGGSPAGRPEFSASTRAKIVNEFFLVGPGTIYPNESAISLNSSNQATYSTGEVLELLGGGVELMSAAGANRPYTSIPTSNTYAGWVTTDTNSATSYTLIAEQSGLDHYLGNIWRRSTVRVKAR